MLQQQIDAKQAISRRICECLKAEIDKLGFSADVALTYPDYDTARFMIMKDPYVGTNHLKVYWYNDDDRQTIGYIQFNSDGSFYAEYDVIKSHPVKANWFIDAVSAWGRDELIKTEVKLLKIPENA